MEDEFTPVRESQFDKLKFELRDFEMSSPLKYGRMGTYYIAHRKKGNRSVFLKIFTKSKVIDKKLQDKLLTEVKLYQLLNKNVFFPELKGLSLSDSRYVGYLFDFFPGGTLSYHLKKLKQFSLEQTKFYSAGIIRALDFLHKNNIIFRDLRPDNILIDQNGYIKFLDITYVKQLSDTKTTNTLCGKPNYLAPELILSKSYGKGVDWWAFGIVLYEMLVGKDPFYSNDPMLVYQNIITNNIHFPKIIDKDAKSLILHLLNSEPKKRYGCLKGGVEDIIEHRLFNDFKWKDFDSFSIEPPIIPKLNDQFDISYYFTKEEIAKIEEEKEKQKEMENETKKETRNKPRGKKEAAEPLLLDPDAQDIEPEQDPFLLW